MSRARVVVAALAVAVLARAEGDGEEAALPAEEDDEARCGSGPFEPCGFFYDVVPWWHLISPLFVLVVLPPVVRWCVKNRARFTGWATLARKYECGDDWPAGTRELGVAAFCRMGAEDCCDGDWSKHTKLDRILRLGGSPAGGLCLMVQCCAKRSNMRPLAIPWAAVKDNGEKGNLFVKLGQLALDDHVLLTFDKELYASVLQQKSASGGGVTDAAQGTALLEGEP